MEMDSQSDISDETVAASYGIATDQSYRSVSPPLYLSSTYAFREYDKPGRYDYGRAGNPTRDLLAGALAKLEAGAGAVVTSSGMAAVDLLLNQLSPTDLVIAPHDCYGGTYRLLKAKAERGHFRVEFIDQANAEFLQKALDRGPSLIYLETPSNPLLRVVDIASIASHAKLVGAEVAVDNTFLTPAIQKPIALGADYVVHSTTKYLNGHSDVVGGAVVTASADKAETLAKWANVVGTVGAPFDAWLTLRGLRTLFPRMERQQETAAAIAAVLVEHPGTGAVHYPGLSSHNGFATASMQQNGFGAMLSFELLGGLDVVRQFLGRLTLFTLAESLGGIESLVAHPATMTHADMGCDARHKAGINENLIRLSIGLENSQDLIADLKQALR